MFLKFMTAILLALGLFYGRARAVSRLGWLNLLCTSGILWLSECLLLLGLWNNGRVVGLGSASLVTLLMLVIFWCGIVLGYLFLPSKLPLNRAV